MNINIIDYAIGHSRVFMGILIFIIFSGASTYITIPKESTPDVSIPIVYISFIRMVYLHKIQKDYWSNQSRMR